MLLHILKIILKHYYGIQAHSYTCTVHMDGVLNAAHIGMTHVSAFRPLIVVGISNGAPPAVALASTARAHDICLCSGMASPGQVLDHVPRRVATVSKWEYLFGGYRPVGIPQDAPLLELHRVIVYQFCASQSTEL